MKTTALRLYEKNDVRFKSFKLLSIAGAGR